MLNINRLCSAEDAFFDNCLEILEYSFPRCERRSRVGLEHSLSDPRYHFMAIVEDDELLGVLTYWVFAVESDTQDGSLVEEFIYVENIAMAANMRNRGLGKGVLDFLKSLGKWIVLEVEPPQDEMSARRIGFYSREGFVLNSYEHLQPPYHSDLDPLCLNIMSWPEVFESSDYKAFAACQRETLLVL